MEPAQRAEVPIEQTIGERGSGAPVRLEETLVDPSESPFEAVLRAESKARVERALSRVPEPYRTTLVLRDLEGFVYEEVAEMQGMNLGTVKSRLVRGRALLKTMLTAPRAAAAPSPEASGFSLPLREEAP